MTLFAFFLGLGVGLTLVGWYHIRLHFRIKKILKEWDIPTTEVSVASLTRITSTLTYQQKRYHYLEAELEASRHLLYHAPIGYIQVDDDNQLTYCNLQARQLLGIQQWEADRPRLLLELVRSYELDQLIEQTRETQKPYQMEWTFYLACPNPSQLHQQQGCPVRAYGVLLPQGRVGVFLENRQEAITLAYQRDRWTSDVAHELKTPLTSIRLVAETLQARLDPPLRTWVDRLLKEVLRLSNLVQDLLDLSQIESNPSQCLKFSDFNLAELVQSAWLGLEPLARQKEIQLHYFGPKEVLIQADEARLYRVLINLLDNGIKYSPPRQVIQVRVKIEESLPETQEEIAQQIHIEVIDAGIGFPDSDLPYVFDRFYRVEPSRARHVISVNPVQASSLDRADLQYSGSSGLGLAIVRQIIEAHHGSVSASNHPETQGAWLQIFLPRQQSAALRL